MEAAGENLFFETSKSSPSEGSAAAYGVKAKSKSMPEEGDDCESGV